MSEKDTLPSAADESQNTSSSGNGWGPFIPTLFACQDSRRSKRSLFTKKVQSGIDSYLAGVTTDGTSITIVFESDQPEWKSARLQAIQLKKEVTKCRSTDPKLDFRSIMQTLLSHRYYGCRWEVLENLSVIEKARAKWLKENRGGIEDHEELSGSITGTK